MEIAELQKKLKESHVHFIGVINRVADTDFMKSVNQKWTAGQQLDHIIKSVAPVNLAFALPAFVLRISFGKANRPSKTYDQLVTKYQAKLSEGGRAPGRFVPASISISQRAALISKLERLVASLSTRLEGFSEHQLDSLILPHPLLGKLTLREMIYFTIYHAGHHEKQVTENLTKEVS